MNRNSSLGIHPREVKIYIPTKTFSYFFAALFTAPQNGQQPEHCQLVKRQGKAIPQWKGKNAAASYHGWTSETLYWVKEPIHKKPHIDDWIYKKYPEKAKQTPKNWCFWTVVLEQILESPLDCKEIKPVHLKGNQPWIFIRRTDAEAEGPILWPPDVKSQLLGKAPDAGQDWKWKKRAAEDELVGRHHQLNGHELGRTLGDGEGQGGLACCRPWGHKE